MSVSSRIKSRKAYRKGHWQIVWWPVTIILLLTSGLIWAAIALLITVPIIFIGFAALLLIWLVWALRRIATWKLWMVRNSDNPKTTLELARSSFLRRQWTEDMTIWSTEKREEFQKLFDNRMAEVREGQMKSAEKKYADGNKVVVHYRFGALPMLALLELIVMATAIVLYMHYDQPTPRIIAGVVAILMVLALFYTIRTLWGRNKTVLEISKHGIKIEKEYYGWLELAEIDIVRGNTLVYKKHHGTDQTYDVSRLSLTGDYLEELIMFYRSMGVRPADDK